MRRWLRLKQGGVSYKTNINLDQVEGKHFEKARKLLKGLKI